MSIDVNVQQGNFDDFLSFMAKKLAEANPQYSMNKKIEQLRAASEALQVKHEFAVGDLVTWKEGLRNMSFRGPFLILELLAEPIVDRELTHITSYAESMDTLILFIDKDGDACRALVSRARIEPYKAEETEEAPATES